MPVVLLEHAFNTNGYIAHDTEIFNGPIPMLGTIDRWNLVRGIPEAGIIVV